MLVAIIPSSVYAKVCPMHNYASLVIGVSVTYQSA